MSGPTLMLPDDEHNRELIDNVHPSGHKNPTANGTYNLVAVGAGTAGLVCSIAAAGLGAKVALIERHLMGGDCLNTGCVPSKGVIVASRAIHNITMAENLGVVKKNGAAYEVAFSDAMARMRKLRARISYNDSVKKFTDAGVDVYIGSGEFKSKNTIEVAGQTLKFKKAVIATGGRAQAPPIPGIDQIDYLTNETVFTLTELPKRFVVIGAGPIGCELAQSFSRFGSEVTVIEIAPQILIREDRDAALVLQKQLQNEGLHLELDAKIQKCEQRGSGSSSGTEKVVIVEDKDGNTKEIVGDHVLVAVGRAPNVDGLGLDAAGVEFDERLGVKVDDNLRTSNSNIFAAGDICSMYKFTHTADFLARIVIQNALFPGPKKRASALVVPWATYTDPEIAHVGMYEKDAIDKGYDVVTLTQPFDDVDRAILDGEDEGFARVHVDKKTGRILGATIVASHAGEMIGEMSVAITNKLTIGQIGASIHPYPTQAEALRRLGDAYNRTRLKPTVKTILTKYFSWLR